MNTTEAIMSRRSVRKFDPEKPVTKEQPTLGFCGNH